MKNYFRSGFDGNKVALYFIIYVILSIIFISISIPARMTTSYISPFSLILKTFLASIILTCAAVILTFFLIKHFLETLSVGNDNFVFDGYIQEFLPKIGKWILYTIISLGFYSPWMLKNIINYFAENTSLQNERFRFKGSGFVLFAIILGFLVFIVIFSLLVNTGSEASFGDFFVSLIFFFLLFCPYLFMYIQWFLNFQWGDMEISYEGNFLIALGIITGNIFLTLVTFGFYFPAAMIRIYRHFANNIVIRKNFGLKLMEMGFKEDNTTEGYIFMILQYILVVITLGIYSPWAFAKVLPWFASGTYLSVIRKENNEEKKEELVELDENEEKQS